MTNALTPAECRERAQMHEQLAATTDDPSARRMHQAMAAEFRRRAESGPADGLIKAENRPMMELCSQIQ